MAVETYYSDNVVIPEYARPDPVQLQVGHGLLDVLRRDPPGQSVNNKYLQSTKFTGPIYLAIKSLMRAQGSVIPQVQRKRKHSAKVTFLPGGDVIRKAITQDSFGQDQEYIPAESDHPVQMLLDHPNERGDTFKDVYRYQILQFALTGVSPLWCVPNVKHQPVEIYALPSALTIPQFSRSVQYPNGAYNLTPYYVSGGMGFLPGQYSGAGAIIPAEEINRRRDPHPFLMWDGYSPLTAGGVELDILEAIDQSWWGMMDHGTILDTILLMPGADQSAVTRLESQVKQRHGGARNQRRFFVASSNNPEAKFDVKQLSPNVRDMDFPNGRATMLEFCLALFGVPLDIVLGADAGSYSKLYANIQKYRLLTLQPEAQDWSDCYSRWLCDPWSKKPGDYRVKLDLPALNDPELIEDQLKTDINIRTVNERRAQRDLPPVPKYGDVPESIYLALIEKDLLPEPTPIPQPGHDPKSGDKQVAVKPMADGPPKPDNPAGEGSNGKMLKAAMSSIDCATGGALVGAKKRRVVRGERAKMMLRSMMKKALQEG